MSAPRPLPVVIGTAGHIDHGKSALIEALTGTHPDRWQEERDRGITLDLGYAQVEFEDGLEIGFVDVPGHERLVRKMVAGATGMGAAMLVVACDDGVMPQTREHFEVLQLLGVRHGLVALTKADLADEDMRELAHADVEDLLFGSAWEGCPIVTVSAHKGTGLADLKTALMKMALQARSNRDQLHAFRLPIQRSFAMHGAGTVVTGVCAAGEVREGDWVEVFPGQVRSRVRRVQVHGRQAQAGGAGLRTALNLPDVEPSQCPRGAIVASVQSMPVGILSRVLLRLVPTAPKLKHGAEVQVLTGTAAVSARVFLPPEDMREGEEFLVDLELEEAMAMIPGDRLILRRLSPGVNLASGRFLVFAKHRLRRKDAEARKRLQEFAAVLDQPINLVGQILELAQKGPMKAEEVAQQLGWTTSAAEERLREACEQGKARATSGARFMGVGRAGALGGEVLAIIGHYRTKNPHRLRIPVNQIRTRLGKKRAQSLEALPESDLLSLGLGRRPGLEWDLTDAEPPAEILQHADSVLAGLAAGGFMPPAFEDLAQQLRLSIELVQQITEYLVDAGQAVRPDPNLVFAVSVIEELRLAVVGQLQGDGMNIPALRDQFQTSRKYLMPALEFLDARGVTVRRGPNRILRDATASLL